MGKIQTLRKTIKSNTPPDDINVIWIDTSNEDNPIQKIYIKGEWAAISGGGGGKVDVDTQMSDTSDNPVANNIIKEYIDDRTEYASYDFTAEGEIHPLYLPPDTDANFNIEEFIENAIAEGKISEEDMIQNYNILGSKLNILDKANFKIQTLEGILHVGVNENVGICYTMAFGYPIYEIDVLTEDNKAIVLLYNVFDIGYFLSLPYSEEHIKNIEFLFLYIVVFTILHIGIMPKINIKIPNDDKGIDLGIFDIFATNTFIYFNEHILILKTDTHYISYSEKGLVYFKHYDNYVNLIELTNEQREVILYIMERHYELHEFNSEDKAANPAINAVFSKSDIAPAIYERTKGIYKFHSYRTNESGLLEYKVYTLRLNGNLALISTTIVQGGGGGGIIDSELSDTSTNAVQNKAIKKYIDDRQSANIYTINIPIEEELTQEQVDYNKNLYELIAASPGNPPVIMWNGYTVLVEYVSGNPYAICCITKDVIASMVVIGFLLNSDGNITDLDLIGLSRIVSLTDQLDMLDYIRFNDSFIESNIYPTYLVDNMHVPCHIIDSTDSYIVFECNSMLSSIHFTVSKEDGSIIKTEFIKARRPIHIGYDDIPLTEEQKAENLKTLEYYNNAICDVYLSSFRYTEEGTVKEAYAIWYPDMYIKDINSFLFHIGGENFVVAIDNTGNATFSEATSYEAKISINYETKEHITTIIEKNKTAFDTLADSYISTLKELSVYDYNIKDYVIVSSFDRVKENRVVTKIKFSIIQPNYPTGDNNEGSLKCLWYILNNDGTVREATADDFIITT